MDDVADRFVIDERHRGPARSGNGGWVAGRVALPLVGGTGAAARVTLLAPPPLDRPLDLDVAASTATLRDGAATIATGERVEADLAAIEPVTLAEATGASAAYPGRAAHPFPTCFGCGPGNPGGLRVFPGAVTPVGGRTRLAAPWAPPADVDEPVVWAALDCVGGWAGDMSEQLMVLGRMTAAVAHVPDPGEDCIVLGLDVGAEGRRRFTRAEVRTASGTLVGRAEHVWVTVDPARFT